MQGINRIWSMFIIDIVFSSEDNVFKGIMHLNCAHHWNRQIDHLDNKYSWNVQDCNDFCLKDANNSWNKCVWLISRRQRHLKGNDKEKIWNSEFGTVLLLFGKTRPIECANVCLSFVSWCSAQKTTEGLHSMDVVHFQVIHFHWLQQDQLKKVHSMVVHRGRRICVFLSRQTSGTNAFDGGKFLSTIKSIGQSPFYGCQLLTWVTLGFWEVALKDVHLEDVQN